MRKALGVAFIMYWVIVFCYSDGTIPSRTDKSYELPSIDDTMQPLPQKDTIKVPKSVEHYKAKPVEDIDINQ